MKISSYLLRPRRSLIQALVEMQDQDRADELAKRLLFPAQQKRYEILRRRQAA